MQIKSNGTGIFVLENGYGHSCSDYCFFSSIGMFKGIENVSSYSTVKKAMRFDSPEVAKAYMVRHGLNPKCHRIRELSRLELLFHLPDVLIEKESKPENKSPRSPARHSERER